MRIEYNGKGQLINIVVDDHESFMVAIDLIRQIAMNQSIEEKNLEFLNELARPVPVNIPDIKGLFDDDIEDESDLDEMIDLTLYDKNYPQDSFDVGDDDDADDLELWLDIEDEGIQSDDDDFNVPRYVEISDQEQVDYWNEVIDHIVAQPADDDFFDRYPEVEPDLADEIEDDPDYDDAIEIPVIIDDIPKVNLLPKVRVECPDCHEFTKVDPLATTFACEHCDKPQFATKGHTVHTYHCPMCDKMNMISICGEGTYMGECSECKDYHLVITKSDGTIELF